MQAACRQYIRNIGGISGYKWVLKTHPTTETENPAKLAGRAVPGRIVQGHIETALKRVVDGLKQEVEHEILCIIFI